MPVIVLTRPSDTSLDWQELDRGPGYFTVPAGHEVRVRIKGIRDSDLPALVSELQDIEALRFLDLSENRNVTNDGLPRLRGLPQLTGLNLSSCTITDSGLVYLRDLRRLEFLDLSYCNRLTDGALKTLESMRSLVYVSLLGCLGISNGGLARIRRKSLVINH
jgi:hypothetical protein